MEDGGRLLACRRLRDPETPLPAGVLLQGTGQLFVSSDFFFPPSPEQPWRIQVEMPSLGNSHPWTKNHTATTTTNINRSFIFVLLVTPASKPVKDCHAGPRIETVFSHRPRLVKDIIFAYNCSFNLH
jgi:hypothetical protein